MEPNVTPEEMEVIEARIEAYCKSDDEAPQIEGRLAAYCKR